MRSGRKIDANEAERSGLINRVVATDRLFDEVMAMARSLAKVPTRTARMTKALLRDNFAETGIGKVWQRESDTLRQRFGSDEHRQAVKACLSARSS